MAFLLIVLLTTLFCLVSSQCNVLLEACLLIADCGERASTTTVSDLDDLHALNTCTTFYGSLYLHTSTDAEYDNITIPVALNDITGGLYCSGGGTDSTTDTIIGRRMINIASDPTEPTTGHVGFVIVDYPTLSSLMFPDLAVVGSDFIIARNPKLTTIEFPSLKSVTGNVDITGDFHTLDLPSLSLVNGSLNLQTSSSNFACPQFGDVEIRGSYACSVGVSNPQPLTVDNSSTNPTPVNASSPSSIASSSLIASTSGSASQTPSSSSLPTSGTHTSLASLTRLSIMYLSFGFIQVSCLFLI